MIFISFYFKFYFIGFDKNDDESNSGEGIDIKKKLN